MSVRPKHKLLLTLGDAAGIGPEIIVKALAAHPEWRKQLVVVGERWILENAAAALGITLQFVDYGKHHKPGIAEGSLPDSRGTAQTVGPAASQQPVSVLSLGLLKPGNFEPGKLSPACGNAAFRYFEKAIGLCRDGLFEGIVTAPLNKEAMNLGGHAFAGHTEILEKLCGHIPVVMSIFHPRIVVAHVTDHLPLRLALDAITYERVQWVTRLTWESLRRSRTSAPRIALAGINPHAGENGLFGREEIEILKPAAAALRQEGLDVSDPRPGDTVFMEALSGRYDGVIAMYHDQGFGPMKTLDFKSSVNCTLGLPFVRTSPDHGTAFDLVGSGTADAAPMEAAIRLALELNDE